jgi:hypothetical protein
MVKTKMRFGICILLMAALLAMGCSTGNSGSDDDDAIEPGSYTMTPTLLDITGVWKNVWVYSGTYGDETDTTTLTINANGTFVRFCTEDYSTGSRGAARTDNTYAERGTVSVSDTGKVTFNVAETYENNEEIVTSLSGVTWTSDVFVKSFDVAIADGNLYTHIFKRQGTGTGIKGTWIADYNDDDEDFRDVYIIGDATANPAVVYNQFSEVYPYSEDVPEYSYDYDSYAVSGGKLQLFNEGVIEETHDLLLNDEFLALDTKYVKQ